MLAQSGEEFTVNCRICDGVLLKKEIGADVLTQHFYKVIDGYIRLIEVILQNRMRLRCSSLRGSILIPKVGTKLGDFNGAGGRVGS